MERVRFGDVVKEVKVNIDRSHNPYEFYVAGDHMDSEDLTIRRKGRFATDDVGPAFIRLFKPGQVLYGSRRTYLKKVAVADFEGITANTTFVLETKDENVFLQKLLPFLMLSDSFTEWSVKKSKGSTNPYVLFSDLADYEFNLPSLEEQRKLADLLWSAYELKESYKRLLAASDEMAKSRFVEMFGDLTSNPFNWSFISLSDVCDVRDGTHDSPGYVASGYPLLTSKNFTSGRIDWSEVNYISKKDFEKIAQRSKVDFGDIVMPMIGTIGHPVIVDTKRDFAIKNVALIKFQNSLFSNMFIRTILESEYFKKVIADSNRGGTQKFISLGDIRKIRIPNVPIDLQNKFAAFIEQLDKSKVALQKSIEKMDSLIQNLIN